MRREKRGCTCSCGAEKASTSFTEGYCWTASSISKGEIVSPPLLMISLDRPVGRGKEEAEDEAEEE